MKHTKITYLFSLLLFTALNYGQDIKSDVQNELESIDSIVDVINKTEGQYYEGIVEGPIIYKSIFRKNGGWEAYYLYDEQNENSPIRIKYNRAGYKTYRKFKFYYQDGELIYTKLNVDFYRGKRKNSPIEKIYYFENSAILFESDQELNNYDSDYIIRTEKNVRAIINY